MCVCARARMRAYYIPNSLLSNFISNLLIFHLPKLKKIIKPYLLISQLFVFNRISSLENYCVLPKYYTCVLPPLT